MLAQLGSASSFSTSPKSRSGEVRMPSWPGRRHARGGTKEATVHAWMNELDWIWMSFFMVLWILLIAALGYAAALVSLREPHKKA